MGRCAWPDVSVDVPRAACRAGVLGLAEPGPRMKGLPVAPSAIAFAPDRGASKKSVARTQHIPSWRRQEGSEAIP